MLGELFATLRLTADPPAGHHAGGHLLGRQLSGMGDIPEISVILIHRPANTPIMDGLGVKVQTS